MMSLHTRHRRARWASPLRVPVRGTASGTNANGSMLHPEPTARPTRAGGDIRPGQPASTLDGSFAWPLGGREKVEMRVSAARRKTEPSECHAHQSPSGARARPLPCRPSGSPAPSRLLAAGEKGEVRGRSGPKLRGGVQYCTVHTVPTRPIRTLNGSRALPLLRTVPAGDSSEGPVLLHDHISTVLNQNSHILPHPQSGSHALVHFPPSHVCRACIFPTQTRATDPTGVALEDLVCVQYGKAVELLQGTR